MKVLRTPDNNFSDIKGYPFKPIYTNITSEDGTILRIHHIDEGPRDGPILLAMHGQPVWSYLYSKMIPIEDREKIKKAVLEAHNHGQIGGYGGKMSHYMEVKDSDYNVLREVIELLNKS